MLILTLVITLGLVICDAFLINNVRLRPEIFLLEQEDTSNHNWNHEPFDFSSRIGWDKFYKEGKSFEVQSLENLEYEWHSHIPHSVIVNVISPTIDAASKYYNLQHNNTSTEGNKLPSILMIGTGNSALPRILHDAFDTPVKVTCLDYSPVCIDMIRSMYSEFCPNMDFILGDATRLKEAVNNEEYDVIVDKGLLDALMCNEGFELSKLIAGLDQVLTRHEWGTSILICFELSSSNQESMIELTDCDERQNPKLFWDFDVNVEGSDNGRATFNLARRRKLKLPTLTK